MARTIDELLPLNLSRIDAEKGKAPTRLLLLRDGDIGWAGLTGFELDAKTAKRLIKTFEDHGAELPIDYHHASQKVEDNKTDKAPAAGWIRRLEYVAGEGLYAVDVEWTAEAQAEIEAKQFKYISPVILSEKGTKDIVELHSVALTNRPRTIDAPMLLEAAELVRKEIQNMEPKDTVEKFKKGVKELVEGLHLVAAQDDEMMPAITDDMKAIADLIEVLRGAGVEIDTTAPLAQVLTAAIEFISSASDTETPEEPEVPPEEEAEKKRKAAEAALMRAKAAGYDKLDGEVKELRSEMATINAERHSERIDALMQGVIDANKVNPHDAEHVASARALAEKDEALFTRFFDREGPYAPVGSQMTAGTGVGAGARGRAIAAASKEFDANPAIACGAAKRFWIDAALQEDEYENLTDAEVEKLT